MVAIVSVIAAATGGGDAEADGGCNEIRVGGRVRIWPQLKRVGNRALYALPCLRRSLFPHRARSTKEGEGRGAGR